MKSKKVAAIALIVAITSSILSSNALAETNGKTHEKYPVTQEMSELIQVKEKLADKYFDYKEGSISYNKYLDYEDKILSGEGAEAKETLKCKNSQDELRNKSSVFDGDATTYSVVAPGDGGSGGSNRLSSVIHTSQANSYYCGPATAAMLIRARTGVWYSQYELAGSLGTTTSGTAWYNGRYPMADTINKYIGVNYYAPYGTSINKNTFKDHIVYDIDRGYGVAGNAYEVVGGPHLAGHPNSAIFHWFAIDGYYSGGTYIWYVDPAAGCSQISWSGNVPKYSSMNYSTLATIVDGRGIIW